MRKVYPHLVLIKPQTPRTESDCELAALRFLRSWKRERQAIQARANGAKAVERS